MNSLRRFQGQREGKQVCSTWAHRFVLGGIFAKDHWDVDSSVLG